MFLQHDGNERISLVLHVVIRIIIVIIMISLLCFLSLLILDKMGLSGKSQDWIYKELPANYAVLRVYSDDIRLVHFEENSDGIDITKAIVEPYISAFWHDDSHIIAKVYPNRKAGIYDRYYYYVDTISGSISGPLNDDDFNKLCENNGFQVEKWILTVPAPIGAEN